MAAENWITNVSPSSGSGSKTVNVTVSKNTGAERSTTLAASGGGLTRKIPVSQGATVNVVIVGTKGFILKTQF